MRLSGRDLRLDLQGDDVALLHTELTQLGFTIDVRELRKRAFGPSTEQAVRAFQEKHHLDFAGVVEAVTAHAINAAVDGHDDGDGGGRGDGAITDPPPHVVTGVVTASTRGPVAGVTARLFAVGFRREDALSSATTSDQGTFQITWTGDLGTALQVRVFDTRAGQNEHQLGQSEVRYGAGAEVTLDVSLDDPGQVSELGALTAAVGAVAGDQLGTLDESRGDISYLANTTGWDARLVAVAAQAQQVADVSDDALTAAHFYALFRTGATPDTVFQLPPSSAAALWRQAAADGIIPAADIDKPTRAFTERASTALLAATVDDRASSLGDLLAVTLGNNTDQAGAVTTALLTHTGDADSFWTAVTAKLGRETADRLRADSALVDLTSGNAPLLRSIKDKVGADADERALVGGGFTDPEAWAPLVDGHVPSWIEAEDEATRTRVYSEQLAAGLRQRHPTATLAARIDGGAIEVSPTTRREVVGFLSKHAAEFGIGDEPVQRFLERTHTDLSDEARTQVTRLQRVYQVTRDDQAMGVLLADGLDSAAAISRFGEEGFVAAYAEKVGGPEVARDIVRRAHTVHQVTLSVIGDYLAARSSLPLGAGTAAGGHPVLATGAVADIADTPTAASWESLFGSTDLCACEHCRSLLSPAAYLVDLLEFTDRPGVGGSRNPQEVLLERRPDLAHLPLSCENTNTALPYIDVVNETLEYFLVNDLTLAGYEGHDTSETDESVDLLANPRFVDATAYQTLLAETGPAQLPFHRSLELLRRQLRALDTDLRTAMAALRAGDELDPATGYGWRDIALERLGVSRQQHRLLTDASVSLADLYGFPAATSETTALTALVNAKAFCRQAGVSPVELADLLQTGFVNPHAVLLPRLRHLGLDLATLAQVDAGTISDADLAALLPAGVDVAEVHAFVDDHLDEARTLLVLNQRPGTDLRDFASVDIGYLDPAPHPVAVLEFVLLARMIRLQRALGWTIAATDTAVRALWPAADDLGTGTEAERLARLDHGFAAVLARLGMVRALQTRLKVKDPTVLLAVWGGVDLHPGGLYDRLFGHRFVLATAFARDESGAVFGTSEPVGDQVEGLRAGLGATADELRAVIDTLPQGAATPLTSAVLDELYRCTWVARALRLPVSDLLRLLEHTAIDLAAPPDPPRGGIEQLPGIELLADILDTIRGFLTPTMLNHLAFDAPLPGRPGVTGDETAELARTVRRALEEVTQQFQVVDDPTGAIARERLALVYGSETADRLFGLVDGTLTETVGYSHPSETLPADVLSAAGGRLGYDDIAKTLTATGVVDQALRDELAALASTTPALLAAVDALVAATAARAGAFFARYPELLAPYQTWLSATGPADARRSALLQGLLQAMIERRRADQTVTAVAGLLRTDESLVAAAVTNADVLHADGRPGVRALTDLVALGSEAVGAAPDAAGGGGLDRSAGAWTGRIQLDGPAVLALDSDQPDVQLLVDGSPVALDHEAGRWRTHDPLTVTGLVPITVSATDLSDAVLRWHRPGEGWTEVPAAVCYAESVLDSATRTWGRLRKLCTLAISAGLSPAELTALGATDVLAVGGVAWPNALRTGDATVHAEDPDLLDSILQVLTAARLRPVVAADDPEILARLLTDPAARTAEGTGLLEACTGWPAELVPALLTRFGLTRDDLRRPRALRRLAEAAALVGRLGSTADQALAVIGNDPTVDQTTAFQSALRARYAEADWREVVRPINDELRALQRDALVACLLRRFAGTTDRAHLDTADKLFEYFLSDVSMEPCMQTSRIRHALSSVQLFIERCLMNLEPEVSPASLPATQWTWMRRYRVWEAARKVFLWPENWLEPELRDDASPFFSEAVGELMQGDVTEDRAALVLGGYLHKLAEVSHLEPSGMFIESVDVGEDTIHVVARTSGARRKYYHRSRTGGFWTPWLPIRLDIEDDPVSPVVWRGRLFVFWVRLIQTTPLTPPAPPPPPEGSLAELGMGAIRSSTTAAGTAASGVTVSAILCYSEFANGDWQPTRTSDPDRPVKIRTAPAVGEGAFVRARLRLAFGVGQQLSVTVLGDGSASFVVPTPHSSPIPESDLDLDPLHRARLDARVSRRTLSRLTRSLDVTNSTWTYHKGSDSWTVLSGPTPFRTVQAERASLGDPFLLADATNCFLVHESTVTEQVGYHAWVQPPATKGATITVPPLVWQTDRYRKRPDLWAEAGSMPDLVDVVDPGLLIAALSEDATLSRVSDVSATVDFGGIAIGPKGAVTTRAQF